MSTTPTTIAKVESKLLHCLMFAAAVLAGLVASSTDVTSVLGIVQKWLPGGQTTAAIVSAVFLLLTKAPVLLSTVTGWISALKGAGASVFVLAFMVGSLLANAAGCAWWQKHEPQFDCAGLATITDAPVLIGIVMQCTEIATTPAAILPCIEGAAGNSWTQDVIKCFYTASQGKASCPAYRDGLVSWAQQHKMAK